MTWLWRHSQQVNNVIAFWYVKLCFGHVLKRSLSAHLIHVTVTSTDFLFEWRIACSLYLKTVWTDVHFLDGSVLKKLNPNRILVFCTSLVITPYFAAIHGSVWVRTTPHGSDRVRSTGSTSFQKNPNQVLFYGIKNGRLGGGGITT